jgi:predicted anti-sigma-YlaC factor YlaD
MECRAVRELADSFLGDELLVETNHHILQHLATCPICRDDVASRRTWRTAVQQAFDGAHELDPSSEFLVQLRRRLRRPRLVADARSWLRFSVR